MSAAPAGRPWGQSLATFVVTLALGPPIGGLLFAMLVGLMPSGAASVGDGSPAVDPAGRLLVMLFVGLFAVPFSYLIGGLQAAAVGLVLAVYGWVRGRPPWWLTLAAGAAAYAGAMLAGMAKEPELRTAFVVIHLVPTIACWAVVRLFWSAPT